MEYGGHTSLFLSGCDYGSAAGHITSTIDTYLYIKTTFVVKRGDSDTDGEALL
jgi:hypothetical protein